MQRLPGERGQAASEGVEAPGLRLLLSPGVSDLGPGLWEQRSVHPRRGVAAHLQSSGYGGPGCFTDFCSSVIAHQVLPVIMHPLPPPGQGTVLATQNTLVLPRKERLHG